MSASAERLEPLPSSARAGETGKRDDDRLWLEETEEKAQRGERFHDRVRWFIVTNAGDADAHFSLGQYHFSRGEHQAALEHFSRAEAEGSAQASYQLGVMLYDGLGTPADPVSSVT